MKSHHIKEAGLYLGLSLVSIVIEFTAIQEFGVTNGLFSALPILFVLFAVAAQSGKNDSSNKK